MSSTSNASRRRQRRRSSSPLRSTSTSTSANASDRGVDDGISRPSTRRRRSARGSHSLSELAKDICVYRKRVLFITGAGISVASGVRPFRGSSGVWTTTIWTNATREAFRKDPLKWYNDFWLPNLSLPHDAQPNPAHFALNELLQRYPSTLHMITQNVDGLHPQPSTPSTSSPSSSSPPCSSAQNQLIEAHGRLGLFKCMPDEDSDTDSEDDDDDERLVHLGHRRKRRLAMKKKQVCRYQQQESLQLSQVDPPTIRATLASGTGSLDEMPTCPSCQNPLAPQALLFDEGYHSHDFYQFQQMEDWLAEAEVIVFCGTSFAVRLPEIALEHARAKHIPVYNINTQDMLEATVRLNATNVRGPSEELMPRLLQEVQSLEVALGVAVPVLPKAQSTSTATTVSPAALLAAVAAAAAAPSPSIVTPIAVKS